ncbi:probable RNA-binding protein CG14230 [Polistes fuscatus]|uniref:probable RNA-binding protein CG14230 n=1 Tax=Polistes fuscatus TaxID=30207 RepID=UPI001CAA26D9|nr:probable RNA-binding protein CG14230 [Polistes fuscatus]
MTVHEEAEKRRLLSLKKKKEEFKAKEKLISDALKNVDKNKANKIVFDDNIEQDVTIEKGKEKRKRKPLFDNEDGDDDKEFNWNDDKFKTKKNLNAKYLKLQANYGNDSRFTLDDRFIEEDAEDKEGVDNCDIENEKEWQFNILEDVLGAPVAKKAKNEEPVKKFGMIRYDPTEDQHKKYELTKEEIKSSVKTKKKKKKEEIAEETNKDEPVIVSKDIYYSVSNSLNKSLNQPGEFSLLKTYGRNIDETDNKKNVGVYAKANEISKNKKSFFNFDSTNPFKYDSSDDENEADTKMNTTDYKEKKVSINLFGKDSDNLFFSMNDKRFKDALNFFKKESVPKKEFKNLRRELKQIVRAKVRKNVRKTEKWGSRKKIKKLS